MIEHEHTEMKPPRCHHHGLRFDEKTGNIVGRLWSGRFRVKATRLFAVSAATTQHTLLALRTDFGLSRGHVASLLGVTEGTVKTWEKGSRSPSFPARRLIWLLNRTFRKQDRLKLADWMTWGRR